MAYGTAEIMTVDAYKGLRGGGIGLAIVSTVGMAVILTLNTAGVATIPSGWTALAAIGMMVSPMFFLGGKILCKLDDLLERVSGVRTLTAQRRAGRVSEITMAVQQADVPAEHGGHVAVQRDTAWLGDMAEVFEMGREIERRRPPEHD